MLFRSDNDICGLEICRGGAAAIEELAFEGGAVGLRGAAAELFDIEGRHRLSERHRKIQHREHKVFTEFTEREKTRNRREVNLPLGYDSRFGNRRKGGLPENWRRLAFR